MKLNKNSRIITAIGIFDRAIETPTHIYFVCFEEGDENANVKMYDRKMKLVCDNIHAHNSLFEVLRTKEFSWMSKKMEKDLELPI